MLVVSRDAISENQGARHDRCGAPYVGIHASGKAGAYAMRCGLRWCEHCASHYRKRAVALIMEALRGSGQQHVWMLTITRRASPGDGRQALEESIQRDRAHWAEVTRRVRYDDARLKKWRQAPVGARGDQWRRLQAGAIRPTDHVTWDENSDVQKFTCYDEDSQYWRDIPSDRAYLWGIEITHNARRRWWHVHRHIVMRSRAEAERYAAAAAAHQDEVQGATPYRLDIRRWDGERAAGYIASYMSGVRRSGAKKGSWEGVAAAMDAARQRTYVQGTRHVRRYDAGGAWRPLGMSRKKSDDPMVLAAFGSRAVPSEQFFKTGWRSLDRSGAVGVEHKNPNDLKHLGVDPSGWSVGPCSPYEQTAGDGPEGGAPDDENLRPPWVALWLAAPLDPDWLAAIPDMEYRGAPLTFSYITLDTAWGAV